MLKVLHGTIANEEPLFLRVQRIQFWFPKETFSEQFLKDHLFKSIYGVAVKTQLAGKGLRLAESKKYCWLN